jgi:hypothetical protein
MWSDGREVVFAERRRRDCLGSEKWHVIVKQKREFFLIVRCDMFDQLKEGKV